MSYKWQVTDASGVGATTVGGCWKSRIIPDDDEVRDLPRQPAYTLTLSLYSDESCATLAEHADLHVERRGVGDPRPAAPAR